MTIYCDNHAVVDVIGGNKTRDPVLGGILREILMLQARANIHMKVLPFKRPNIIKILFKT